MTEAECSAAGKEWLTDGSCTDICAEGTPVIWGCRSFQHGRGYVCDCSAKYGNEPASKCAEEPTFSRFFSHYWSNECKDKGDGCNALPSTELVALRAATHMALSLRVFHASLISLSCAFFLLHALCNFR